MEGNQNREGRLGDMLEGMLGDTLLVDMLEDRLPVDTLLVDRLLVVLLDMVEQS